MKPFRALSAIEQLAVHLRGEIRTGKLGETLPGLHRLAKQLSVSPKSVVAAVGQLEHEGLLRGQGPRRRCLIMPGNGGIQAGLKIRILAYEKSDRNLPHFEDLRHRLTESGHQTEYAAKDLQQLGMDPRRVERFVNSNPADAWVVIAGSRGVLEWFAEQQAPVFALFGRQHTLPIAGGSVKHVPAMQVIVRRLVKLGHRRIVWLAREERRKPQPGMLEQAFLDELERNGIKSGSYNLPDWENSRNGFLRNLDRLLMHTAPTAMIIHEPMLFAAAQQRLARRGIVAPEKISLICIDHEPTFDWFEPAISHVRWDPEPLVRGAVRWANEVARGKPAKRKVFTHAEFVEGGTIGPAKEK